MSEEIATLDIAKTPAQAQLIVSILDSHGIPAHIPGAGLVDEFAMAQRAMNMSGVKIEIPADRLDEAKRILEESREMAKNDDTDS